MPGSGRRGKVGETRGAVSWVARQVRNWLRATGIATATMTRLRLWRTVLWQAMGRSMARQSWMAALLASVLALFVLVSAVEAATCAPESMTHASATIADAPSDPDDTDSSEQHAICSHGHCHHSGAAAMALPELGIAALTGREPLRVPPTDALVSSAPTGPDRPPQG